MLKIKTDSSQFAQHVKFHPEHVRHVRNLDLSHFSEDKDENGIFPRQACWREFKYRKQFLTKPPANGKVGSEIIPFECKSCERDCGIISHERAAEQKMEKEEGGVLHIPDTRINTHPAPNPRLRMFARERDIPSGAIINILAACKNIRYNILEFLSLEPVLSPLQIRKHQFSQNSPRLRPPR